MSKKEKIMAQLRASMPYLSAHFGVKRLALFGSYAAGTATRSSDLDLLVEFSRPVGLAFVDLAEYIEKKVGVKADIITPAGMNGIRVKDIAARIGGSLEYV